MHELTLEIKAEKLLLLQFNYPFEAIHATFYLWKTRERGVTQVSKGEYGSSKKFCG